MCYFKTLSRHDKNFLSSDSDLNFIYNCKKIRMSLTYNTLKTNKMKNLDLKRVQLLKENSAEYSQQLKTG